MELKMCIKLPTEMNASNSNRPTACPAFFAVLFTVALAAGSVQADAPGDSSAHSMPGAMLAPMPKFVLSDSQAAPVSEQKVSLGGAFLRSVLIPGWGQKAVGANTSARNFFVVEAALWAGVVAFNVYGNWLEDDMQSLAAQRAGVQVGGKNEQYFVDIGNFLSIDEYNQSRLQNRDALSLYDPATHYWRWDTDANRLRFKQLRLDSDRTSSNAELVVAAILANHIISGIHAAWLAHRANEAEPPAEQHGSIYVPKVGVAPASGMGLRLTMRWKF